MTVLGAMDCGEFGLLAADSGRFKATYHTTAESKIWRCQKPALAWAFAGDEGVGRPFNEWLSGRAPAGWPDWNAARLEIAEELARRNGERFRELQLAAGNSPNFRPSADRLASALVVGWLGSRFEILQIAWEGSSQFWGYEKYFFAGSAGEAAVWVKDGIERATKKDLPLTAAGLRDVMETVAERASFCTPPVRMVKITTEGVTDL